MNESKNIYIILFLLIYRIKNLHRVRFNNYGDRYNREKQEGISWMQVLSA
jgi:hypothetical protein